MEFPDSVITNVYRIDDILAVRWSQYRLVIDATSHIGTSKKIDSSFSQQTAEEEKLGFEEVQYVENQLRLAGWHVVLDEEVYTLWVFELIDANEPATTERFGGQLEMAEEYKLTEMSSGLLRPSEMPSTLGLEDVSTTKPVNIPSRMQQPLVDFAFQSTKTQGVVTSLGTSNRKHPLDLTHKSELKASEEFTDSSLVYTQFLEAISRSLSLEIAKTGRWLPLGSGSFVGPLSPTDHEIDTREDLINEGSHELLLFSLCIELLPSGTLIIAGSPNFSRNVRRVSDMFDKAPGDICIAADVTVVLAPSGETYSNCGELDIHTAHNSSVQIAPQDGIGQALVSEGFGEAQAIKSLINHLFQQGVKISPHERWVRLGAREFSLAGPTDGTQFQQKLEPKTIWWPASLCFVQSHQATVDESDMTYLYKLPPNSLLDPLAHAEAWFRAKSVREDVLRAVLDEKQKERELEARLAEEAHYRDEQNTRSESDARVSQYLSTQDASRIYPTPPDGLRSEPPVPLETHSHTTSLAVLEENSRLYSEDDEEASGENRPPASPDLIVSSTRYEQATDDDLFREMDTGLFATSGLTDADFSFFDEPSEDEGMVGNDDLLVGGNKAPYETAEGIAPQAIGSGFRSLTSGAFEAVLDEQHRNDELLASGSTFRSQQGLDVMDESLSYDSLFLGPNNPMVKIEKSYEIRTLVQPLSITGETMRQINDYIQEHNSRHSEYKRSTFDSVAFKDKLEDFDSKYIDQGRFGFEILDATDVPERRNDLSIATIAVPRLETHQSGHEVQPSRGNERCIDQHSDRQSSQNSPISGSSFLEQDDTDEEESSEVSVLYDDSSTSEDITTTDQVRSFGSYKRKRERRVSHGQPTAPSLSISQIDSLPYSQDASAPDYALDLLSTQSGSQINNQCLENSPRSASKSLIYTGNGRFFIQIAQILADQSILEPVSLFQPFSATVINSQLLRSSGNNVGDPFAQIIPRLFTKHECCRLREYAALNWTRIDPQLHGSSSVRRGPIRSSEAFNQRGSPTSQKKIVKLESPYACVRRAGTSIEISSSALHFWEELGLAPAHDIKDITAFCIFPAHDYIQDGVETFLSMMGIAYQSCNLGSHVPGSIIPLYQNGLVPVTTVNSHGTHDILEELGRTCERLGRCLSQNGIKAEKTAIYIVNPFRDGKVLPWLCAAFFRLYISYRKNLQSSSVSDLLLQIVPLDLVASLDSITLPPARAYNKLAMVMYDRCGPNPTDYRSQGSQFRCTPAIRLARALPKTINFKLTPEPSTELLHSDKNFHMSYSWSSDREWLTASWTDNQGALQWNAAYCLGQHLSDPWQAFLATAREIWETTLDILRPGNSQWMILIAKDRFMHKEELRVWLSLRSDIRYPAISTVILTVVPDPPLYFPRSDILNKNLGDTNNFCTTPVSTPLPSTFSPEQSGFVSTPSTGTAQANASAPTPGTFDHNAEAKLMDITDETWGLIMARCVESTHIPPDSCRALISGYLVKRAGVRDEDGLIALGVNIVHAQKPDKILMKDVLRMYRGLGLLARVRGIVDPRSNVLPWHVAATMKAYAAVSNTMQWIGG